MKHLLSFLLVILCTNSCHKEKDDEPMDNSSIYEYSDTYIPCLMIPQGVDTIDNEGNENTLRFAFDGKSYLQDSIWTGYCKWKNMQYEVDKNMFTKLAKANNDTSYFALRFFVCCPYLGYGATNISVVSNANYDENHPAGCELNDIIELGVMTSAPYVNNNYNRNSTHEAGEKLYIKKLFSEYSEVEKRLWEYDRVSLHFPSPTSQKEHKFVITFEFEDGTKVRKEVEMRF